jgi:hypothetical protein
MLEIGHWRCSRPGARGGGKPGEKLARHNAEQERGDMDDHVRDLVEFWLSRLAEEAAAADDPTDWARVQREIDADRLLLRQYEDAVERCLPHGDAPRGEMHGLMFAVKCRVSVYADHADYRKEWAPADVAEGNREASVNP